MVDVLVVASIPSAETWGDPIVRVTELRSALRAAIKKKLEADTQLQTLMGGTVAFRYRPTRQLVKLPVITMSDYGTRSDDIVPLFDRNYQIDCWANSDLDLAEDVLVLRHLLLRPSMVK